jgi:hypothetical protein
MKTDHDGVAATADTSAAFGIVSTPTIARRSMLRSDLRVSPPVAFGTMPDQKLIDLGAQFEALCEKCHRSLARQRLLQNPDHAEKYDDVVVAARIAAVDRVCDEAGRIPAKSLDGFKVKARMLEWHSEGLSAQHALQAAEYAKDRVLWSLVCDLLASASDSSAAPPCVVKKPALQAA